MVILALIVGGVAAMLAAWTLVASGHVAIWPVMASLTAVLGLAALATGRIALAPRVGLTPAALAGLGSGLALYLATAAFVLVARRFPVFDRHVEELYDQRRGLSLGLALLLAVGLSAPGEELFWRGLVQGRLAAGLGWPLAALATWGLYAGANLASRSLPIVAGGIVAGAAWSGLALWSHGVLAGMLSHVLWTGLMLTLPPGGTRGVRPDPSSGSRPRPASAASG